ncbi:hypothetical protein K438DRAFT_2150889 [Mycena galopus ATCC 62051]|nr:hypothetical protein K438DRAFT_2150889 [Mycena galopus ATCC 62051]
MSSNRQMASARWFRCRRPLRDRNYIGGKAAGTSRWDAEVATTPRNRKPTNLGSPSSISGHLCKDAIKLSTGRDPVFNVEGQSFASACYAHTYSDTRFTESLVLHCSQARASERQKILSLIPPYGGPGSQRSLYYRIVWRSQHRFGALSCEGFEMNLYQDIRCPTTPRHRTYVIFITSLRKSLIGGSLWDLDANGCCLVLTWHEFQGWSALEWRLCMLGRLKSVGFGPEELFQDLRLLAFPSNLDPDATGLE